MQICSESLGSWKTTTSITDRAALEEVQATIRDEGDRCFTQGR